ncbi:MULTISPECIES: hypothetical protein [Amycolatopsis]|jgi:hypothetical protein|uniref:Uncharacterized protein n=2 Tax=Amycolatopsis TaxID=1813 RepID=A0A8E1W8G0_9PSEU|nr:MULTISPECIES: hypothetical protein [Amycolatopsis]MBB2506438.1 hypothetical protein [Amycolatopsis echigonensis]WIV60830.1 hypothetical protein QP939_20555 [Amycolatopsis sp. 2-2]HWD05712.1 hypothetical protein [Amycolatopsis sp.]
MGDPYLRSVRTAELTALARAIRIVDDHGDLNHRYEALIDDSQVVLDSNRIRLTQARGLAKRLVVLAKAAGTEMRAQLTRTERDVLDAGLAQADGLIRTADSGA